MKVLCISPGYWPAFQFGGPVVSVHGLNKTLGSKGVDVTVYATNSLLHNKVPVNQEVELDGVKVTYFSFLSLFEFLGSSGWQFSWQISQTLKDTIKTFDLVHINAVWNYPVAVASYYCRKYKKPYIIAPRGTLYPFAAAKSAWKKKPYYYFITKNNLMGAAAVHYTTQDEYEKCHSILGLENKAIIIPNGINRADFDNLPHKDILRKRYPILEDKVVILFLGRISWIKGLDVLVKAFAALAREMPDMHLLIAGPDESKYEEKIRKWINDEGIKDRVTFTGMLNGNNKLEALAGSDLFVLPSYSENFGVAVVEAMACGLPVIISNKVGIHKEVENNKAGMIVDTTADSLYEGIKTLVDNSGLRKRLANNAVRLVEKYYDIDIVADKVITSYEEIAGHV